MQVVGKHYCQKATFQVRFGRSKIRLDIPENGKVTKEGWRITPTTLYVLDPTPQAAHTEECIGRGQSHLHPYCRSDEFAKKCKCVANYPVPILLYSLYVGH